MMPGAMQSAMIEELAQDLTDVIEGTPPTKKTPPPNKHELDFEVENMTGKETFVTCFSYVKLEEFGRWKWRKSKIYHLKPQQHTLIDVATIPDEINREYVFGYLGVFANYKDADQAIYELLDDRLKVDLGLLYKLKGRKVTLGVEKYGFKGRQLDYTVDKKKARLHETPELDFLVENQTGRTLYITAFIYQHKDSSQPWRHDKTIVKEIPHGSQALMDVDTITSQIDRNHISGSLGVFDSQEMAEKMTYELMDPENKLKLGRLIDISNDKIVISIEKYGVVGNIIDYTIKPIRKIDFKKPLHKHRRYFKLYADRRRSWQ